MLEGLGWWLILGLPVTIAVFFLVRKYNPKEVENRSLFYHIYAIMFNWILWPLGGACWLYFLLFKEFTGWQKLFKKFMQWIKNLFNPTYRE